jgi:hypothetical protein
MGFTSPVDADLTQIDIALSRANDDFGKNNFATVSLWRFQSVPIPELVPVLSQPWTVTNLPLNPVTPTLTTISGITGVHLDAGALYYLSATSVGPMLLFDLNTWDLNSVGLVGPAANNGLFNGGPLTFSADTLGAFDIIGDPTVSVPSPIAGTGLPGLMAAFGALGLLRWRGKKKPAL